MATVASGKSNVGVGEIVAVGVTVNVGVIVGVRVTVEVAVGVEVGVAVDVAVAVEVGVGVGDARKANGDPHALNRIMMTSSARNAGAENRLRRTVEFFGSVK
jgi:hypothetical protein